MGKLSKFLTAVIIATFAFVPLANACEKYQIKEIQKVLSTIGQNVGPVDGLFGAKTKAAFEKLKIKPSSPTSEVECNDALNSALEHLNDHTVKILPFTSTTNFKTATSKFHSAIRYLYPINLDSDPEQEILIAGFESQGSPHNNPGGTFLHIFDWNKSGYLVNATERFVQNNQFGGVGEIVAGDFNGDGKNDLFLSGYTDSTYEVGVEVLYGGDGEFYRTTIDKAGWQHGAAVGDLNNDGFDDIIATGYHTAPAVYIGSPTGLTKFNWHSRTFPNGSGVEISDLDGDQKPEVIISDNSKNNQAQKYDVNIYAVKVNSSAKIVSLSRISSLPKPELENDFWSEYFRTKSRKSHDIRIRSIDLNSDGSADLVLFSVARNAFKGSDRNLSNVQVFLNKGNFQFSDATNIFLIGYRNRTNVSYSPIFHDINSDGHPDLYSSEHDFDGFADSLQIFLSKAGKKLVALPESETTKLLKASASREISTVVLGHRNKNYIVRHVINGHGINLEEYLAYHELIFE